MSAVTIHCPKCAATLRLPNRNSLGKKGRCPSCKHLFVLEEPEEVSLELVEPPPTAAATQTPVESAPAIPDLGKIQPPSPTELARGRKRKAKGRKKPGAVRPPVNADSTPSADQLPQPGVSSPQAAPAAAAPAASAPVAGLNFSDPDADASHSTIDRVRNRRRRKSNRGPILIGAVMALVTIAGVGIWYSQQAPAEPAPAVAGEGPGGGGAGQENGEPETPEPVDDLLASPTAGEPIPLDFLPFRPHLICHMRPSVIWSQERSRAVFAGSLLDLGQWLQGSLKELTGFEASEIESITFAMNFGRDSDVALAAKVRLVNEQSAFDLQRNRFQASRRTDLEDILENESFAFRVLDGKTFVFASAILAEDLAGALKYPNSPAAELECLLKESDQERDFTLVFDATIVDTHRDTILPLEMQDLADAFALWLKGEVRGISWSLHFADTLYMETLLRHESIINPRRLQQGMAARLQNLPGTFAGLNRRMQPADSASRQFVGRFPAMMQAIRVGTRSESNDTHVRMTTVLPTKAAPNLALASLLTWKTANETDFDAAPEVIASAPKIPDTVLERLKLPVIVDFRRMPLQEALAYIGDEIKVEFVLNGDALKGEALTQNMAQTFNLGEVPANTIVKAILDQYPGRMAMVLDESKKQIMVTTPTAATEAGQTTHSFGP